MIRYVTLPDSLRMQDMRGSTSDTAKTQSVVITMSKGARSAPWYGGARKDRENVRVFCRGCLRLFERERRVCCTS